MIARLSRGRIGLAIIGLALFAAGADARAETIRINVDKLVFAPAQVSARVGDTIEWVNADILAHTATARDKHFDVVFAAGRTGRLTLTREGDIEYYCRFHPNMVGRLSVTK
jgi:plastocyanin